MCLSSTVSACLYFESVKRPGPIFYILIPSSYTRVCNKETDNSSSKTKKVFYFENYCVTKLCVFLPGEWLVAKNYIDTFLNLIFLHSFFFLCEKLPNFLASTNIFMGTFACFFRLFFFQFHKAMLSKFWRDLKCIKSETESTAMLKMVINI